MNFTNISFGSDLKFSNQEIKLEPDFFKKSSSNAGKLTTDTFKGDLNLSDIKFPSNIPIFENAFRQSQAPGESETPSAPPTPPSTRPYLWKYQ
jgi:hypothetical protein